MSLVKIEDFKRRRRLIELFSFPLYAMLFSLLRIGKEPFAPFEGA